MKSTHRPISQTRRDILRAFFVLERETGRTAFKSREVWQQVPHINRSTLGAHVNSSMNDGLGHKYPTHEVETVGREGREKLYSLSSLGRQRIKDFGLNGD